MEENSETMTSRTELDTHANMPVIGQNALSVEETGSRVDVHAYSPDYPAKSAPLVHAAIQYDCPYNGMSYIFLVYNAVYVPSMENNLIPPFLLREAGIRVNDTPKIHSALPDVNDHAIYIDQADLRIHLRLHGIFSYFETTRPSIEACNENDNIFEITPVTWNPHTAIFAHNEDAMIDWEGNMVPEEHRPRLLMGDIEENPAFVSALQIGPQESQMIDKVMLSDAHEDPTCGYEPIPTDCDEVKKVLANVSVVLEPDHMLRRLQQRNNIAQFTVSIGATVSVADQGPYLLEDDQSTDSDMSADYASDESVDDLLDSVVAGAVSGEIDLDKVMASATSATNKNKIDAQHLAKIWRIDYETAKRTLDVTTQNRGHTTNPDLTRNYSTNDRMLRYRRINEHFFMDTFFATKAAGKSSRGHNCCQLFVTDKGFVYVVPMRSKSEVLQAVKQFTKEIGAPDAIVADPSKEQTSLPLRKFCSEIGTTLRALEEGTPWSNRAELYIGLIKSAVRKDMKDSNCPLVFWDYCVERRARVNNLTAKNLFQLHGTNAHTATLAEEGDISNLARYGWYEWCYYHEHTKRFPFNREVLGRVLGPARGSGNEMAQWVLKANGNVVPRRTLRPLTVAEQHSDTEATKRKTFDTLIERRWGTSINPPKEKPDHADGLDDSEEDEDTEDTLGKTKIPDNEECVDSKGRLLNQQPAYDKLLNSEIQMQIDETVTHGTVKRRAIGADGRTIGTYDDNPLLNTMVYEVEFPDGQIKEYSANLIVENMLTQVDEDGYTITMMEGIVDYHKDDAVAISKSDGFITTRSGQRRRRKSTQG